MTFMETFDGLNGDFTAIEPTKMVFKPTVWKVRGLYGWSVGHIAIV